MFIGHFAAGLAGKRLEPAVSLAVWFMAVQFLDLIWPIFLLAGLEHVRIDPGNTAFTPLDFYDYPISHSLIGVVIWASLFAGGWMLLKGRGLAVGLLFAGVVSHWVLDVVAHRPDLPILPGGPYVGLGLWRSVPLTIAVEGTMFAAGIAAYSRTTRPRGSFWALMAVLLVLYLGTAFGPPPPSVPVLAAAALAGWLLLPWAWWADRPSSSRVR